MKTTFGISNLKAEPPKSAAQPAFAPSRSTQLRKSAFARLSSHSELELLLRPDSSIDPPTKLPTLPTQRALHDFLDDSFPDVSGTIAYLFYFYKMARVWTTCVLLFLALRAWADKTAADYFVHSLPGQPDGPLLKMHAG